MAGAARQVNAVGELEEAGVARGGRGTPDPDGRAARRGCVELAHEFVYLAHKVDDIAADDEITRDLRIEPGGAQECRVVDAGLAGGGEEFVAHSGRGLGVGQCTAAQRKRQPHPSRAPADVDDVVVGADERGDLSEIRVEGAVGVEAIRRCVLAPAVGIEGVQPKVMALRAGCIDQCLVALDGCHDPRRIARRTAIRCGCWLRYDELPSGERRARSSA